MFISDFAIRKPIATITVMIALVVFGLYALMVLDVDEFPEITNPIVFVAVPYPGASPEQVERDVVDPMEESFNALSGIDQITSTSMDGFAQIVVQFVFSKDVDQASQDVRDAISSIQGDLPAEMEEPVIQRFDPNQLPIVSLTLSAPDRSPAELTRIADPTVTRELRGIEGVAQVTVQGEVERELTVQLRPAELQAAGIGVQQVVQALQAQNLSAPVGRVNADLEERTIRLRGRLESPQDFLRIAVGQRDGQLIRLGQVADVEDGTAEARSLAFYNGRPAVGLDVTKSREYSTASVADAVKERVDALREQLPDDVQLDVVRDAGDRVENSVRNVQETLFEGAVLTVLVIFLFLNSWRSTVITGLALPVSVLASFIAVWAFGFTLNTMSLLGLSLAIGILIDDAIVVRENIVRHIEMGKDHYTAAREGTDEIGLAVAATTFSIVAVFVPVAFMEGVAGQWFKPLALTIACAVLVSLFVSFSLDPMLSAYWPDPQLESDEHHHRVTRWLARFNDWFDRQAERYEGIIAWALDHRWTVIGIAVLSFAGAIGLQMVLGGGGFVPQSDRSELNIAVEVPPGSSIEYTRIKTLEVSRIARSHPQVAYTYTTVGSATGSGAVDEATVYVRLVPRGDRDVSQQALGEDVRTEIRRIAGANAYVYSGGFGGNEKQIQIQLRSEEGAGLERAAEQVREAVRGVPDAVDVGLSTRGQKPELDIEIERALASTLGLSPGQIAQALRPAFAGIDAGDWVDPTGETREVRVRLDPSARRNATDLAQLPLVLPEGSTVPLGQVARIEQSLGPAQVQRLNRDRVITVGANVDGRSLSEVSADIDERLDALELPPGVSVTQGGEVEQQGEVFTSIFAALGLAILLMYLILVVQFGSFLDPLAILVSLPLSLIGVVLALIITGDTLNIMSMIGVILLMGIVAKNAILLIDFCKWGRERGQPLREAMIEAGRVRLRPIMMTTVSLIAGMTPVALGFGEGGDFRAPLGRAVIGGVITSTLLTLLVIPTVYEILDDARSWVMARLPVGGDTPPEEREREPEPEQEPAPVA
ncbi:MAG: efflux RND transporter permease subunit [Gemmatimonadota bacterium]|nr:efflux RND transporter permease subunit [Gemmatimonadota bacterium]